MFGREAQLPIDIIFGGGAAPGENHLDYVEHLRQQLEGAYTAVREHMAQSQKYQKQYYDRRAVGGRYQVGDLVWLYSPAVPKGRAAKFHRPWKGPYQVTQVLSDVTYRITLLSAAECRDRRRRHTLVVHFNRLKPCHSLTDSANPSRPNPTTPVPETSVPNDISDLFVSPLPESQPHPVEEHPVVVQPESETQDSSGGDSSRDTTQEQPRGGAIWGSRLRRTTRPPDYYNPTTSIALLHGEGMV